MSIARSAIASTLEESIDWAGHLEFLDGLLKRHDIDPERKAKWQASLVQIRSRRKDPNLYIAVIGEFSSGKSTAINALIRQNLLPADVLPATTAAATLVRYGPHLRMEVEYLDGRSEEIEETGPVGELLKRFIATEEIARTVARVTVYCPAPVLQKGLVAVDTPGSNVENQRHVELAGWALREICDAAIIAIPANIPVSETLAEFLHLYLEDVLHRCLFVATKIDLVRPADRPRLLSTIAARLKAKLKLERPLVVALSAATALGEPLPDGTDAGSPGDAGEDYRSLQAQFLEAEQTIARTLEEQRSLILLERASALLSAVFEGLAADLQAKESHYQADHLALEANRIRDLQSYIRESKSSHGRTLGVRLAPLIGGARGMVAQVRTGTVKEIESALKGANSETALREIVREEVPRRLGKAQEKVGKKLGGLADRMGEATQAEVAAFESEFRTFYTSLQTLGGRITNDEAATGRELSRFAQGSSLASTQAVLATVQQDEERQNRTIGAGALTGAALGQILIPVPVLGAVIGGFVGAVVGAIFTPSVDTLRERYRPSVRAAAEDFFVHLESAVQGSLEKAAVDLRRQMEKAIDGYFDHYDALVQRMVERDRKRAEELAKAQRSVRGDLDGIERRRQSLQQIRVGLQTLQKL